MAAEDDDIEFDPQIDPMQLDKEWLRQIDMYWYWSRRAAKMKTDVELYAGIVATKKAEAQQDIRENPTAYKLDKVVADTVNAAVQTHKMVVAAIDKYNKKRYQLDLINAVLVTLDHRRRALDNLVQLQRMNYIGGDLGGSAEQQGRATKSRMSHSMEPD